MNITNILTYYIPYRFDTKHRSWVFLIGCQCTLNVRPTDKQLLVSTFVDGSHLASIFFRKRSYAGVVFTRFCGLWFSAFFEIVGCFEERV